MSQKSFFEKRTPKEIGELSVKIKYNPRGLVRSILDLNPDSEALELRFPLIPMRFFFKDEPLSVASRKCYKHGDLIALEQPLTRQEALECKDIPLAIRERSFTNALAGLKEEEITFIGYSWYPVQGRDRRKRIVPFPAITDGVKLFAYSEQLPQGIEVDDRYIDSRRVKHEGARILCKVPSRTKKKQRYPVNLIHFPVEGVTERRAVIWSLKTQYDEGREPLASTFKDLRFTRELEPEVSDIFSFGPHDIAAYIGAIGKFWKTRNNMTPLEMNPFALTSRLGYEYANKLDNNVVIYDPTLESKTKLRNLHLAERAILQSRLIKVLGVRESVFWDWERDGKLKDY